MEKKTEMEMRELNYIEWGHGIDIEDREKGWNTRLFSVGPLL